MRVRIFLPVAAALTLAAPTAAQAAFAHVVGAGESLSSVAAADGLSVDQLAAANGISPDSQLVAGSTLLIPPQTGVAGVSTSSSSGTTSASAAGDGDGDSDDAGAGTSGSAVSTSSSGGSYVVAPGDTLSAIAARAGMSVAALAAANGLDPNGTLVSGTALRLSGTGTTSFVSSSSASSVGASEPVGAAAQGNPSNPPYPTPERVSASQVSQIASANGVPPALAEAVGWQESGFNNALVSAADARGVMQILPGTWDWIQHSLAAGSLAPASASENVRGGVLLLHSLLGATGGDPAMAAAGYYQGLSSVRQNGLYSDTQQYVNSVLALANRFGGG